MFKPTRIDDIMNNLPKKRKKSHYKKKIAKGIQREKYKIRYGIRPNLNDMPPALNNLSISRILGNKFPQYHLSDVNQSRVLRGLQIIEPPKKETRTTSTSTGDDEAPETPKKTKQEHKREVQTLASQARKEWDDFAQSGGKMTSDELDDSTDFVEEVSPTPLEEKDLVDVDNQTVSRIVPPRTPAPNRPNLESRDAVRARLVSSAPAPSVSSRDAVRAQLSGLYIISNSPLPQRVKNPRNLPRVRYPN